MVALLYRSLFVIGIAAFMAVAIFGNAGPQPPFQPIFPTFSNPFDGTVTGNATYFPDGPTKEVFDASFYIPAIYFGCTNTTYSRQKCINTDDRQATFIRFSFSNATFQASAVAFNMTPSGLMTAGKLSNLRDATFTIVCRTPTNASIAPLFDLTIGGGGAGDLIGTPLISCPVGEAFQTIVYHVSYPSGIANLDPISTGLDAFIFASHRDMSNPKNGIIDISYIRADLVFGTSPTCDNPGGTFAAFYTIACGFVNIWKTLQWIGSGLIFVGQWLIAVGQIIANYIAVIVWLYNIPGMPAPIQGFLDVYWTIILGTIGIEVYKLIKPFGN